jgi:hypothetical protein
MEPVRILSEGLSQSLPEGLSQGLPEGLLPRILLPGTLLPESLLPESLLRWTLSSACTAGLPESLSPGFLLGPVDGSVRDESPRIPKSEDL